MSGDTRIDCGLLWGCSQHSIAKICYSTCRVMHNNAEVEAAFVVLLEKIS